MKKLITSVSSAVLYALPAVALAQNYGLENLYGSVNLGNRPLLETVGQVINVLLSFLGVLAVVGILWGGFQTMIAAGDEEKAAKGKKVIAAGVIGLAIILAAFAIAAFVIGELSSATGAP